MSSINHGPSLPVEVQRQSKTGQIHKLYWVLYTIATVFSFIVTIIYWTLVHDPGKKALSTPWPGASHTDLIVRLSRRYP